jgi:hypothetical protein
MATKSLTPEELAEQLDAELAAHDAARNAVLAKQAALRDAGAGARKLAEITYLRSVYNTVPDAARKARQAAAAELAAVAAEPELDLPRLVEAFAKRQAADAECGTSASFVFQLDQVDPLPPGNKGQAMPRPPRAATVHGGAKFSDYLDELITARANGVGRRRYTDLSAELAAAMDTAERDAILQSGGDPIIIEMPETSRAALEAELAAITDDDVTDEAERLGHVDRHAAKHNLERAVRERFIAAERGEDPTKIQPYTPITAADNPIVMGKNGRLHRR